MFREKIPVGRIIPPFFFESSESDRFFNYLHDSNSIFRVGRINQETFSVRAVTTTSRRTSSGLFRCVVFACAPMHFVFSHLHLLERSLSHDRLSMPMEAISDTGG